MPFYGAATSIRTVGDFVAGFVHPSGKGYYLITDRGAVYTFGPVPFHGAATDVVVAPIVDATFAPDRRGYWMVDSEGHVYAFGNAPYHGNLSGMNPGTITAVL